MRWDHPEHGLLLPGEFLPEAELNGTIVPLGTWSVEHACRQSGGNFMRVASEVWK